DLTGYISDTLDVRRTVLFREPEAFTQMRADYVAVEQRNRPCGPLEQPGHQGVGNGRFAGAGKAGKKDGKALLVPGRMCFAQFFHDLRVSKPLRYVFSFHQATAQLGT